MIVGKMPTSFKFVIFLELFIIFLGFATGFHMIHDPSGISLAVIGGIVLFMVYFMCRLAAWIFINYQKITQKSGEIKNEIRKG